MRVRGIGRVTGTRAATSVLVAVLALGAAACGTEGSTSGGSSSATTSPGAALAGTPAVSVPAWTPEDSSSSLAADAPTPTVEAYGPDPAQTLEVFQSSGSPVGTIVYVHGGAWMGGSMQQSTSTEMMTVLEQERAQELRQLGQVTEANIRDDLSARLDHGWDLVSIDYRLATDASGPGVRGTQIMNDVDRAMRYVWANAERLGLDTSKFVVSGGSAGGHLALMYVQTQRFGTFTEAGLPADLAAAEPRVDGVIAMVAPTDLETLWQVGGIAPYGQEALLGCALDPTPVIAGMPHCDDAVVQQFSPLHWTKEYQQQGLTLPPAYFAYGGSDTLVLIATQGVPNIGLWAQIAGKGRTWYDFPPQGTHNIDDNVNQDALAGWLDDLASGDWDGSGAQAPE